MWTGLIWLRIGTGWKLLWIRYWTFGFHEMLGNYRVASRVVLSSIELVPQNIISQILSIHITLFSWKFTSCSRDLRLWSNCVWYVNKTHNLKECLALKREVVTSHASAPELTHRDCLLSQRGFHAVSLGYPAVVVTSHVSAPEVTHRDCLLFQRGFHAVSLGYPAVCVPDASREFNPHMRVIGQFLTSCGASQAGLPNNFW
jgi:hypothetical protein